MRKIYSFNEFNTNESKLGTFGAILLSVAVNFAAIFYSNKNQHEKVMKNKLSTALRSSFSYKTEGDNGLVPGTTVVYVDDKKIMDEREFKSIYGNELSKLDQEALYSHYVWGLEKVKMGKITYDPIKDQLSGMPKGVGISIYSTVDAYQDDIEVK